MRKIFALLVGSATLIGLMFIENPQAEALVIQQHVVESYAQAREYVSENPERMGGSALMMFCSTVTWFAVLKFIRYTKSVNNLIGPGKDETAEIPNPIVVKAQSRALYSQLTQDRIILIGRSKWLPEEIAKVRKEWEQAVAEETKAKNRLLDAQEARTVADNKLSELEIEQDNQKIELVSIDQEIRRLKTLI